MPKYLDLDGLTYLWGKIEDKFVEQETGKGLSTNDFTTTEKNKLAGIESGAEANVIESVSVNGTALTPFNKNVSIQTPQYVINANPYDIVYVMSGTLNNVSGAYLMYNDGSVDPQSAGFFPDMIGVSYAAEQVINTADDNAQTLISAKVPVAGQDLPLMDGTAEVGVSNKFALADHVHPTDTSRQATLVSGTNIKTINGNSILGSGNLTITGGEANVIENISVNGISGTVSNKVASVTLDAVDITFDTSASAFFENTGDYVDSALLELADYKQDTLVSGTNIKTINSTSLLGSGNIAIEGLPSVSSSDNGKVLRVVNGVWSAVSLPSASGVSF